MALSEMVDPSSSSRTADADSIEIIRATSRFALDLRLLSPVVSKGEKRELSTQEKDARRTLERVATLATTARNTAMRELLRRDGALLDDFLAKNGRMPKKGEVEWPKSYSYPVIRQACPEMASGMAATIAREVDRKWSGERIQTLIFQVRSAPHFRVGQPFPVRAQDCTWTWDADHKRATVRANLLSGLSYHLPIEARDAYQERILRCLASGEWKAGEVRIERDRLRPAKWYLKIAYKRKVERRTKGQAAAISLGMKFFLVSVTQDGQQWIYDGADIEAHLKRNQAMRQSYQRGVKASARVGRGRPRALKSIEHLAERSDRYRQTRCAVIARRLASWLRGRGVSRVYLGELTDIRNALPESLAVKGAAKQQWIWERIQEWPYFRLGQSLRSALETPLPHESQQAIEVIDIEQDYHSQRCPACGYTDAKNRELGRWTLWCKNPEKASRGRPGCGYHRHLDLAQSANALARASGEAMPSVGDSDPDGLGGGGNGKNGGARKPGGKRRK